MDSHRIPVGVYQSVFELDLYSQYAYFYSFLKDHGTALGVNGFASGGEALLLPPQAAGSRRYGALRPFAGSPLLLQKVGAWQLVSFRHGGNPIRYRKNIRQTAMTLPHRLMVRILFCFRSFAIISMNTSCLPNVIAAFILANPASFLYPIGSPIFTVVREKADPRRSGIDRKIKPLYSGIKSLRRSGGMTMTEDEIRLLHLSGQHLLSPAGCQNVSRDLCGVQAQFLTHALHGLAIRSHGVSTDGMLKSWTLRGTMHLFVEEDLPLFLHEGRSHFLRPVDTMESDAYISKERKAWFASLIVDAIGAGLDHREGLKALCADAGMTDSECKSLFDPWGGIIRALCESGRICHRVQEQKAYRLCPTFTPMEELPARLELARRYFTNFGPATVRDAAHFFGKSQSQVRSWLKALPVMEMTSGGRTYFHITRTTEPDPGIPPCLFLAGFDQLMLGYEKTESLHLSPAYISQIFTRSGIVRPVLLLNGQAAGWWNLKNRKLTVTLFASADQKMIADTAVELWTDLKKVEFIL